MSFLFYLRWLALRKIPQGLFFFTILFCCSQQAHAQDSIQRPRPKKDTGQIIHLLNADILVGVQGKDSGTAPKQKLIGNVRLEQGHTIFTSDSAIRYMDKNILDAYGHIHINQADSIDTYADELHYIGDTKLATLRDHVKMTDGSMILTTDFLDYNMHKHIGTYFHGGKLVNQETILTSEEGEYFADLKDVYFKKNVKLNNPEYKLTTDTLLYNTVSHIATFVAPTAINTGQTIIYTSCGYYNTNEQFSFLCNRPTIVDSMGTLTADSMKFSKTEGLGRAFGNIVWTDTSGQATVQSNFAISDNKRKTLLATQDPLLIFAQEKDSLFVSSDTLFSGPMIPVYLPEDSLNKDTIPYVYLPHQDSSTQISINEVNLENPAADTINQGIQPIVPQEELGMIKIPLFIPENIKKFLGVKQKPKDQKKESDMVGESSTPPVDSSSQEKTQFPKVDSTLGVKKGIKQVDTSLHQQTAAQTADSSLKEEEVSQKVDSADARNLIAYHHVRLYSDSLQGVADSLYYSGIDSTFHFYGNPILWTGETQLFGDTIVLVTKNQKPYKLILRHHAMIINKVASDAYNQIKGRIITGYFNDSSQIDWMNVAGNAESVYFAQEDSSGAVIGINKATASFIKLFFENNHLDQVKFFKNISGHFLNPAHVKKEDIQLEGFKWENQRRPPKKPDIPRIKIKKKRNYVQKRYPTGIERPKLK